MIDSDGGGGGDDDDVVVDDEDDTADDDDDRSLNTTTIPGNKWKCRQMTMDNERLDTACCRNIVLNSSRSESTQNIVLNSKLNSARSWLDSHLNSAKSSLEA